VTDRADTANSLRNHRHLFKWPPVAKALVSPELRDVKAGILNFTGGIQVNGNLPVAL
jgi:hypothetical protein